MIFRIFSFAILLLLLACTDSTQQDISAVIQQRADDRIATFKKNLWKDCSDNIIETALAKADSIIIDRARKINRLAARPPKPSRPGQPIPKELSKELPLRPLFPFEIRFDTLLRDSLFKDSLRIDSLNRLEIILDEFEGL